MGFIYPWSVIKDGKVPRRADFGLVRDSALRMLQDHPDSIVAATVWGSVANDSHNERSDFDMIIIGSSRYSHRAKQIVDQVRKMVIAHHICPSFHMCFDTSTRAGKHFFGPSYHLTFQRLSSDRYKLRVGRRLSDIIRFTSVTSSGIRREVRMQINNKLVSDQNLAREFWALSVNGKGTRKYDWSEFDIWLNRCFESEIRPRTFVRLARWMLLWRDRYLYDDSKRIVIQRFMDTPAFVSMHTEFNRIVLVNEEYFELLRMACDGKISRTVYLQALHRMLQENFEISIALLKKARTYIQIQPLT